MPVSVNGKTLKCPECGETERIGITGMDSTGGTAKCMNVKCRKTWKF